MLMTLDVAVLLFAAEDPNQQRRWQFLLSASLKSNSRTAKSSEASTLPQTSTGGRSHPSADRNVKYMYTHLKTVQKTCK